MLKFCQFSSHLCWRRRGYLPNPIPMICWTLTIPNLHRCPTNFQHCGYLSNPLPVARQFFRRCHHRDLCSVRTLHDYKVDRSRLDSLENCHRDGRQREGEKEGLRINIIENIISEKSEWRKKVKSSIFLRKKLHGGVVTVIKLVFYERLRILAIK